MKVHIFGGGTFSHVRSHLALAVPAFGETARQLYSKSVRLHGLENVELHLTKMADPQRSTLVTNEDVEKRILEIAGRPDTGAIILNAALCDWEGFVLSKDGYHTDSGKYESRLESFVGSEKMHLSSAPKILPRVRAANPNIVLVGFKTTCGADYKEMQIKSLKQIMRGADIVLANDVKTRQNTIFSEYYGPILTSVKAGRNDALETLVSLVHEQVRLRFPTNTVGNV